MVINGVEFEFDIMDEVDAKKMEDALTKMDKAEKEILAKKNDGNLTRLLKDLNKMMADFFIECTGVDVLKGVTNFNKSKEYYFIFLSEIKEQKNKMLQPFALDRIR